MSGYETVSRRNPTDILQWYTWDRLWDKLKFETTYPRFLNTITIPMIWIFCMDIGHLLHLENKTFRNSKTLSLNMFILNEDLPLQRI